MAEALALENERENVTDMGNIARIVSATDRMMAQRIADGIRALEPATPLTQAEDAVLMALAADMARKYGDCYVRVRLAAAGEPPLLELIGPTGSSPR